MTKGENIFRRAAIAIFAILRAKFHDNGETTGMADQSKNGNEVADEMGSEFDSNENQCSREWNEKIFLFFLALLIMVAVVLTIITAGMAAPTILGVMAALKVFNRTSTEKDCSFHYNFPGLICADVEARVVGMAGEADDLTLTIAKPSLERQIITRITVTGFPGFIASLNSNLDAILAKKQKNNWKRFILHVLLDAWLRGIVRLPGRPKESINRNVVTVEEVLTALKTVPSGAGIEATTEIAVKTFADFVEKSYDDYMEKKSLINLIIDGAMEAASAVRVKVAKDVDNNEKNGTTQGEQLKSIVVANKSTHAVTLFILANWTKSHIFSLSIIIERGDSFLFQKEEAFRFELGARRDGRKLETFFQSKEWEKDTILRVSGRDQLEVEQEELPSMEKQICIRRQNMKEDVSASGNKNLYEILALNMKEVRKKPFEEQQHIIKKAYRSQLRRWHPDKNPENGDNAICREIIFAYEILKDPEARAAYNNVADYDRGWLSKARWRAVFNPECYSDAQKSQYRKRMGLLFLSVILTAGGVGLTFLTVGSAAPVVLGIIAASGALMGGGISSGLKTINRESIKNGCPLRTYVLSFIVGAVSGAALTTGVAGVAAFMGGAAKIVFKVAQSSLEDQISVRIATSAFRCFIKTITSKLDAIIAGGPKMTWKQFILHVLTDALLGGVAGVPGGLTENMIQDVVSAEEALAAFETFSSHVGDGVEKFTSLAAETFFEYVKKHYDDNGESTDIAILMQNAGKEAAKEVARRVEKKSNGSENMIQDVVSAEEALAAFETFSSDVGDGVEKFTSLATETFFEYVKKHYDDNGESTDIAILMQNAGKEAAKEVARRVEKKSNGSGKTTEMNGKSNKKSFEEDETNSSGENNDRNAATESIGVRELDNQKCSKKNGSSNGSEKTNQVTQSLPDGKHKLQYISDGVWFSKMIVDYEENGKKIPKAEVKGSGSLIWIPSNATNIEVGFQVMRGPGVWCDVKKYDFLNDCWVKPAQPHIFKYKKPVSCTYTLAGNLYCEKVVNITRDELDEKYDKIPEYKDLIDEINDETTEPGRHILQFICEGLWLVRMLVDYEENGVEKHYEVEDSKQSIEIPNSATNVKVRFQATRFLPGIWFDVNKYDRFKEVWIEPTQPHIFEYDQPVSRTYTLAGNALGHLAVIKMAGDCDDEISDIDDKTACTEENDSLNGSEKTNQVRQSISDGNNDEKNDGAEGGHLKSILIANKSPHAVTLYIFPSWTKRHFLLESFIVEGGENFLFHKETAFRFELTARRKKKKITIWGPMMWERDMVLRVSGDDGINLRNEDLLFKDKQIFLRRENMEEDEINYESTEQSNESISDGNNVEKNDGTEGELPIVATKTFADYVEEFESTDITILTQNAAKEAAKEVARRVAKKCNDSKMTKKQNEATNGFNEVAKDKEKTDTMNSTTGAAEEKETNSSGRNNDRNEKKTCNGGIGVREMDTQKHSDRNGDDEVSDIDDTDTECTEEDTKL
ncbi:uncharacterized protein LOC114526006 isoform X2 [Dendronephthya gigantea]|uniref:uncharacterized protein LOC114526006 isoform X2 n=1 Tax=Dendronephthya gigantea TaxID=151771 RepID=UPI00106CCBA6|nr:uncharacterized protein LOC114526006 isoform X2 [Dendronephthya gigantea]